MKVILVERERRVIRRVTRILYTIDNSIQITAVLDDFEALVKTVFKEAFPDLVLINQDLLGIKSGTVEAKLTIATRKDPIVYLAFRAKNLVQLQKKITSPAKVQQHIKWPVATNDIQVDSINTPHVLKQPVKKRFLVSQQQKLLSIAIEEIAYFFSDNRFIFFKTFDNKKFWVEYRMDELEALLDKQLFFRVNRSNIISINAITAIYTHSGSRCKIILRPPVENEIIVSRERLADFKKWLGE